MSWASMSTMSREKFSLITIRSTVMCSALGGRVYAGTIHPRSRSRWERWVRSLASGSLARSATIGKAEPVDPAELARERPGVLEHRVHDLLEAGAAEAQEGEVLQDHRGGRP